MKNEKIFTQKYIKIGRTHTFIFNGDCVRHIIGKDVYGNKLEKIIFIGSEYRNVSILDDLNVKNKFLKQITDWSKEDYKRGEIGYFVPCNQKCSKKFLKEWKKFNEVELTESESPIGNKIYDYIYNMK
jgi:hypothetical protein